MELRPISLENLDEVIGVKVRQDQSHLVADNLYSIAQASLDPSGWCRAAYLCGVPVGFFFVREFDGGTRPYLCRFMVDQRYQRKGVGRRMLKQLLALLFSSADVELVELAVCRDHGGAESFYERCGFTSTDEPYRGGRRMVLRRRQYVELLDQSGGVGKNLANDASID